MNCDAERAAGNIPYIIGLYLEGKEWKLAEYISLEDSPDVSESSRRTLSVLMATRKVVDEIYGDKIDDRDNRWLRSPYNPYIHRWHGLRRNQYVMRTPLVWIPPHIDVPTWVNEYISEHLC